MVIINIHITHNQTETHFQFGVSQTKAEVSSNLWNITLGRLNSRLSLSCSQLLRHIFGNGRHETCDAFVRYHIEWNSNELFTHHT